MTILVVGPNGSGKSAFAEALAARICRGGLCYIATLLPCGEEGAARVEKHRAQRAGMGFVTFESPYAEAEISREDTVLLEDVSNLLANLMFEKKLENAETETLRRVLSLRDGCENLIAVSIGGLQEEDGTDAETKRYIAAMHAVNDRLQKLADTVVELVSGTPVIRKGRLP
jgi:adenosylcobinamide kinase/adenosylcobinamide-phosphate guanylyltransferase